MVDINLYKKFKDFDISKEDLVQTYLGVVGIGVYGDQFVDVPNRPKYVYVRIRNNVSEVAQAYNDLFTLTYGQAVLVQRYANGWKVVRTYVP